MDEKSVYFTSDLHLGAPTLAASHERERAFVAWLDAIGPSAQEIHLVGDVFDFWVEYRAVVPKGFVRLLGALARWADRGVAITFHRGNHDFWFGDYLPLEVGAQVVNGPITRTWFGKTCYLAHGDALGPREVGFRRTKALLANPFLAATYRRLPSAWGVGLAHYLSRRSSQTSRVHDAQDHGEREHLWEFATAFTRGNPDYDYLLFGHRHLLKRRHVTPRTEVIWLGDWLTYRSYAVLAPDGTLGLHQHTTGA